jgi:cytochrome c oxidase cbb3-type subunit 2
MPAYPFLAERSLRFDDIAQHLKALRAVGVPYSDEMIAKSRADLEAQVNPDADPTDLLKRYPRAVTGKFNAGSSEITELDALIAYLQMLGTLVRISDIPPERLRQ